MIQKKTTYDRFRDLIQTADSLQSQLQEFAILTDKLDPSAKALYEFFLANLTGPLKLSLETPIGKL